MAAADEGDDDDDDDDYDDDDNHDDDDDYDDDYDEDDEDDDDDNDKDGGGGAAADGDNWLGSGNRNGPRPVTNSGDSSPSPVSGASQEPSHHGGCVLLVCAAMDGWPYP